MASEENIKKYIDDLDTVTFRELTEPDQENNVYIDNTFLKCTVDEDCLKTKFKALLANPTKVVLNKLYYEIPKNDVENWLNPKGGKSRRKGRKSRRKFRKSKNRRKKLTKKMV